MRGQGCNGPTYILILFHSVILLCLPLSSWQYYDNHSLVFVNETSDKMISEWVKPNSIDLSQVSRTGLSAAPLNVTWPKQVRFCNTPDFPEEELIYFNTTGKRRRRYLLQGSQWDKHTLTWTLRTPSRRPELSEGVIRQQMYAAFKVWQDASTLVFQEVHKDTESVDIYVDFVTGDHNDGYKFDGKGNVLAHAFYPGVGRGGDVHFDDDETFVTHSEATEYGLNSLLITAAHELGHSLGITHSNSPDALMAPWYQDFPEDFTLPDDDKYAIQALYGIPDTTRPPYIPTRPYIPPTIPPTEPPYVPPTRPPYIPTTRPYIPPTQPPYVPPTHPPSVPPTRPPYVPPTRPPYVPPTRPPYVPPTRPPYVPPTRPPYVPPTRPPYVPPTRPPYVPPTTPPYIPPTTPYTPPEKSNCFIDAPPPPSDIPDTCNTDFDAATLFRREIYFFKGKYFWRIKRGGRLYNQANPAKIHEFFIGLPKTVDHIDAVYEDRRHRIVFISGSKFFVLGGNLNLENSGDLLDLHINASHVDAAMIWGHNGRTYLFSGEWYWRLSNRGVAESDYPRYIGVWRGVPRNFSAAFTRRSATYFIAGKVFWSFNTSAMSVSGMPSLVAPYWFDCPHYNQKQLKLCSLAPSLLPSCILHLFCSVFIFFLLYFHS